MNPYLKNLSKIEFVVTDACTGHCKHCSQGEHAARGEVINPQLAADAVRKIAAAYNIKTVMTFGGEPLLCPDAVCEIIAAAKACGVPRRQVITNGCFSSSAAQMQAVASRLAACGVNDLLLSVDAFHQETLPLETVKAFASAAVSAKIPVRLSPAWLVSNAHDNPYNRRTREILEAFKSMNIPTCEGNVIFPEGNALRCFADYFADMRAINPYEENPRDVRCISFSPNGDVLDGNAYRRDIMEILKSYTP